MSATFWLRRRAVLRRTYSKKGSGGYGWSLPKGFGACEICNGDVPILHLLRDPLARRCRRCESSA